MGTYNVVALDGGGVRGVISAVFLDELIRLCPGWLDHVDLFVGTSIGAANAVSLADREAHPGPMVAFYRDHGAQLFSRRYPLGCGLGTVLSLLRGIPVLGPWLNELPALVRPKWSPEGLEDALRLYFRYDRTLGDIPHEVVLTTLQLDRRSDRLHLTAPVCMSSRDPEYAALLLPDALLRSMSAPGFFPSTADGYVDGGVFAANPAIAALGKALTKDGVDFEDVRMLSIGTGIASDGIPTDGRPLAWGEIQWARAFPGASTTAEVEFDHWHCQQLLGDRYCRLNVELPRPVPGDDWKALGALETHARETLGGPEFRGALDFVRSNFS